MLISRTKELEKLYESLRNRSDATKVHIYGFAKNLSDEIQLLQRSIDLAQNDAVPYGRLVATEGELRGMRALLKRVEADIADWPAEQLTDH
jgi:hypothetical protein